MRLTLRENGATVPCLCTGITAAKWRLIPNPNRILVGQSEALKEVVFGIVNLGQFYVQEPPGTMHQNPLELIASPWRIVISEPRGTIIAAVRDGAAPTFPVVHMGSLTRTDGMPFSSGDAQNLLDGLHWFLSFAAGQWVAPAFVTGVGATGETLWQEWGTRLVQPNQKTAGWFDEHHGEVLSQAFPGFMALWSREPWHEPLGSAIYWYVRSSTVSAGADGSLILSQAALELLAWQILVVEQRALSAHGFKRLPAEDKIRLLLNYASIPVEIPLGLAEWFGGKENSNREGPRALVETRNSLVHPNPGGTKPPIAGCMLLGLWYLELVLLRLFEFTGSYSNRTALHRWVGQVEQVPWAKCPT